MSPVVTAESAEPTGAVSRRSRKRRVVSLLAVSIAAVVETLAVKRKGYGMGGNVVVRCRAGHLFTTIWIPLGSLKAVRLGWARLQRCPVGKHWSLVTPVRESDLTDAEREAAAEHRDVRVP
jgi:hypothetical protein